MPFLMLYTSLIGVTSDSDLGHMGLMAGRARHQPHGVSRLLICHSCCVLCSSEGYETSRTSQIRSTRGTRSDCLVLESCGIQR
jgi:hypothetical protein